eukprot:2294547-Pyramimonas_sp.AAC.1
MPSHWAGRSSPRINSCAHVCVVLKFQSLSDQPDAPRSAILAASRDRRSDQSELGGGIGGAF